MMQPELQAVQKKYKGKTDPASREAMGRETMELYRKHGTNPMASCLPILLQSPIFFALFRVLNHLSAIAEGNYRTSARSPACRRGHRALAALRRPALRRVPDHGLDDVAHRGHLPHRPHERHHVLHPAPADDEEHAEGGPRGADGEHAEDDALHPSGDLPDLGHQLPGRCADLLGHLEPVVHGAAVLHDQADAGARFGGGALLKEKQARKAAAKGAIESTPEPEPEKPRGQREQPKRKNRQKRR